MLIGTLPRSPEKRLCLIVRNEPFRQVLAGLLGEWRYSLLENPAAADLLLAEEGLPLPTEGPPVLRLTRSGPEDGDHLLFPLSPEKLWTELENRFHTPPRSRICIRIGLILPAQLQYRNLRDEIRIDSLSDLGCRFDFNRELVPGEELVLDLLIGRCRLKLHGLVIYVVPRGDLEGSAKVRVGVMFDYREKGLRKILHNFIIRTFLQSVREGMTGEIFREGLAHFDVPPAVLREIPL